MKSKKQQIYFIQADNGDIKIGITLNPKNRLRALQTHCPLKLKTLKLIDGDYILEKKIHKLFKDFRIRGEWFLPCRKLINLIHSKITTAYKKDELRVLRVNGKLIPLQETIRPKRKRITQLTESW